MSDDITEDMVRREVAAARQILRDDKVLQKLNKHFPDEPTVTDTDTDPDKPKPPDKKPPAEPPKKRGLWWGDSVDN